MEVRIPFTDDKISGKGMLIGGTTAAAATLATEHLVVPAGAKLYAWTMVKVSSLVEKFKSKKEATAADGEKKTKAKKTA